MGYLFLGCVILSNWSEAVVCEPWHHARICKASFAFQMSFKMSLSLMWHDFLRAPAAASVLLHMQWGFPSLFLLHTQKRRPRKDHYVFDESVLKGTRLAACAPQVLKDETKTPFISLCATFKDFLFSASSQSCDFTHSQKSNKLYHCELLSLQTVRPSHHAHSRFGR